MNHDLAIGLALSAVGMDLLFLGMPKQGVSPRFLQFDAAIVLYTPLILMFLAAGAAEIITALVSH
jgi:hypothetical protein